jgi:hypothetical protein
MGTPSKNLLDNIGAPYICLKMDCGYTADNIDAVIQHMEEEHPEVIEFIEKMS